MNNNFTGYPKFVESGDKRQTDILEETAYINLMALASQITKQHPSTLNGYEQEIIKIADFKIRSRYKIL